MLLSIGVNKKIGKEIGVFNLPWGITCPGKSEACKVCYAFKTERIYKTAKNKRKANLEFIKKNGFNVFVKTLIEEIKTLGLKAIRIHESGDFYCQKYIDAWFKVIKACPDVKFLAYTRSYRVPSLDLSKLKILPNLNLFASTDYDATIDKAPTDLPKAHLVRKTETPPKGFYTCITKDLKDNYCGTFCKICWNAKASGKIPGVYFDQH